MFCSSFRPSTTPTSSFTYFRGPTYQPALVQTDNQKCKKSEACNQKMKKTEQNNRGEHNQTYISERERESKRKSHKTLQTAMAYRRIQRASLIVWKWQMWDRSLIEDSVWEQRKLLMIKMRQRKLNRTLLWSAHPGNPFHSPFLHSVPRLPPTRAL